MGGAAVSSVRVSGPVACERCGVVCTSNMLPWHVCEMAGAPTVQRPVEVSRERVGPHSWRVTLSDGSTQEEISWDGCYRPAERAKRAGRLDKLAVVKR